MSEQGKKDRVEVLPMNGFWVGHWTFDVIYRGERHQFRGVPNYTPSKRAAVARGAWRLKWLREGTYGDHYRGSWPHSSVTGKDG